ncbi:HlyD family secretion protein [Peptoclostridium litorale DSM 5388]|uniref:CusB-like beta-barrel domain-containing protein n=1 Tax=Peptoclostridium litorale DSM 5388 TaxID=1121324 RepID=A0A069RF48_PEPLI|nr:HlyD family efflux transporter periplasmic adaptor subunit [Peptoclostridium litorale]KDR95649.1 hypothetical protein CLIT_10c03760 [Peptoclostridium litorale DSM 5388]SIO00240.1 HlyD family secretion protein [Peptoclostridium litorale DSM 5388]
MGKIKEGDEVIVKIPDISNEACEGVVTLIGPSLDESGNGTNVEIAVISDNKSIKPGLFAEIGLKK